MALVDVAGLPARLKHSTTVTTATLNAVGATRLAVLTGHPPGRTSPEIGVLCGPCSPAPSRVAWPCWTFRRAADGLVLGLLT